MNCCSPLRARATALCIAILALVSTAFAQYKETLWIPVIFYDFHSDKSCPEFEMTNSYNVELNMVQKDSVEWDTKNASYFDFDSIMKPIFSYENIRHNRYIKYWYRDWNDKAKADSTIPNYQGDNGKLASPEIIDVDHDTAFINKVIYDSLPFKHIGNGVYQFDRSGSGGVSEFFWIDNRGFGNEGKNHNYSFTMELHWPFEKKPGLNFEFNGDDDVWVFIEGELAMDLGGVHPPANKSFNVDDIPGLVDGQDYMFSLFYAERHTVNSTIKITTNIISAPPDSLHIRVEPDDTIKAGQTLSAYAEVIADTGVVSSFDGSIQWGFVDLYANNHDSTLKSISNTQASFTPTEAYTTVKIWGRYADPEAGVDINDTAVVVVVAGAANHVVIEPTADSLASLRDDNPKEFVRIPASEEYNDQLYAILRDRYGNWVSPADPATWTTADESVATATSGSATERGQGRIDRVASDRRSTTATVTSSQGFQDDITVTIDNITYDALRIVVLDGDYKTVDTVRVRTDRDTTLYVQGQRSDNGQWEAVVAKSWSSSGVSLDPSGASNTSSWKFSPEATGTGTGTAAADGTSGTIMAHVILDIVHGPPDRMDLYDQTGDPSSLTPLADTIEVKAGTDARIVAKLFDNLGEWLSEFESVDSLRNRIAWTVDDTLRADLSPATGHSTSFSSTVAHRAYTVTATYAHEGSMLTQAVAIKLVPADASQLVLEPNEDGRSLSPNQPQRFDNNTLTITSEETYGRAYAVLRDTYGNWVGFSNPTGWRSASESIVTVKKGIEFQGEGIISRVDTGQTTVTATDTKTGIKGELSVKVIPYYYTELKILVHAGTDTTFLDSLVMTTNDDTTLSVIGLRSDTTLWEAVSVTWQVEDPLSGSLSPPKGTSQWTLAPTDTGRGWVRATLGNDERTTPDTVGVRLTPGQPTGVEIELLTPAHDRIAGEPITAQVTIRNEDGLVPGPWCGSAVFADILGAGYTDETSSVIVTDTLGNVDTIPLTQATELCFDGGQTTVDLLLYYAPASQDPHQISVVLDGDLTDATAPFVLKPGPLASLVVEKFDGTAVEDTVRITVDESVVYYTRGYDRFGNPRGNETANWSAGGNLHDIDKPNSTYRLYYDGSPVIDKEEGMVTAVATDSSGGPVSDQVYMVISGKGVPLSQAFTRDLDGDGYLDAVELHFTKAVQLPPDSGFASNVRVQYSMISFTSDSIAGQDSTFDSVFVLYMVEDSSARKPQTSWQPYVSISNWEGVKSVPEKTFVCTDGAGPVVWRVLKSIKDPNDRTQDRVKVLLSEKTLGSDGKSISVEALPADLFRVYEPDGAGGYDTLHAMLDSIPNLVSVASDSVIEFNMANGNDLLTRQLLNLKPLAGVTDKSSNTNQVHRDNRKARVELVGPPPEVLVPFPNPTRPTFRRESPGALYAKHNPQARKWVLDDKSATVLTFPLTIPGNVSARGVSCFIKVYDAVGNLVNSAVDHDLLASIPTSAASVYNVDLYWNGSNAKGMPVAAGVYRVVVYIDYESSEYEDARLQTNVGVGR